MRNSHSPYDKSRFPLRDTYDVVIIGAGAAGLMAASSLPLGNFTGLLVEHCARPGIKLLMSGGGRCNITHEGSVKDFPAHYGLAEKAVRRLLYRYSNDSLTDRLREFGVETVNEEGRIFPASMKAETVLNAFLSAAENNGFAFTYETELLGIEETEKDYLLTLSVRGDRRTVRARRLLLAGGGLSYPTSGSDGSLHRILVRDLDLPVTELRPSLYPLPIEDYPYENLAGLSLNNVTVSLYPKEGKRLGRCTGPLLFTHEAFSGPAILNLSRAAEPGAVLEIQYVPLESAAVRRRLAGAASRNPKAGLPRLLREEFGLPHRLAQALGLRASGSPKRAAALLTADRFPVHVPPALVLSAPSDSTGAGSPSTADSPIHPATRAAFRRAMVTAGGVDRSAVSFRTMEAVAHPRLYLAGEILDVDGETGGYNLQFAWSSASAAAESIRGSLGIRP